jgi:hypothetical protein
MELGIFTPSRPADDFNGVPELSKRRGLFWEWTAGMLGLPDASATVPLRFQGLSASRDNDVNWQIDAVARRDARMRALNLPPTRGEVVAGIVGDVVAAVRRVTKTQAAVEWLAEVLQHGPLPQKTVEELAKAANIGTKPLKTAKAKLKVQSTRKGRKDWAWRLPFAKAPKGGQP